MHGGAHGLITTPGATRFYKSQGDEAVQSLRARLAPGARLEWLPLETLAYRGCRATNRMHFELAPGAEMMGWDVLALGLPAASEHFDDPAFAHGRYTQEVHLPGVWLERGTVAAHDTSLLDSPLGWAGRRVMATLWWASGSPAPQAQRDALLRAARQLQASSPLAAHSGSTSPHAQVVVLRVLADALRIIATLLQPFMPESMGKMLDQLGVPAEARHFAALEARLPEGTVLPAPQFEQRKNPCCVG